MVRIYKSYFQMNQGEGVDGVVTLGDPGLKRKIGVVRGFGVVREKCDEMVEFLRKIAGAGLAAPQLGINLPIVVIEVRKTDLFPDRPESPLYVMINPKILKYSKKKLVDHEGCFSVPGMIGKVKRSESVELEYQDLDGNKHKEKFSGYIARVIQHEVDHLNGLEYLQRMDSMTDLMTVENWKKFYLKK